MTATLNQALRSLSAPVAKSLSCSLCFLSLLLAACSSTTGPLLPGYSGNPGELIVVMNNNYWNGPGGELVMQSLGETQPGLPQPEPRFTIVQIAHKSFSQIFEVHRNILIVDINKDSRDTIEIKRSSWASGQIVVRISSATETGFMALLEDNYTAIVELFNREELKRLQDKNSKFGDETIEKKILEKYNVRLNLQKDAFIAADSSNSVCWVRLERERPQAGFMHQISQGLIIYQYPYIDTSTFSLEYQTHMRDSITSTHIPGPSKGSYMTISHKLIEPESRVIEYDGQYAMEVRGLWRVEGDFMGGPYVSLSTVDEKNNRVVTIDGYVFAPEFDKREYLREVEAMVKSLRFD